ncbi:MAG TPA: long-chain fatty acid--CoA ligase [Spirochaetota bacterium]|nr:long-chain fatty acid--CoA ligase [Spirochaetota bacterium]HNU90363.1 long-chain fatty acid--CoA ligase [Spirochaetota bacterium]HPV96292.1 long-chain fatty acid--CoA ligase [Spirochaetota bacterium]
MAKYKETSVAALFQNQVAKLGSKGCVAYKKGGRYTDISWNEMDVMIRKLGWYLMSIGIKKGDKVAIFSPNRYEWWVADQAILSIGAVNVPIYATNSAEEALYVLAHSESKACLCGSEDHLDKVLSVRKKAPKLKSFIIFDDMSKKKAGVLTLVEAFKKGEGYRNKGEFDKRLVSIKLNDLATIIYTSGTTGNPKGVMLSHSNFISNVNQIMTGYRKFFDENEVFLSFLPLSHSLERTAGYYMAVALGAKVAFAEDVSKLQQNLTEVQPTVMVSVPRIYEKVHAGILAKVADAPGIKKAIFNFAIKTAAKNLPYICSGKERKGLFAKKYNIADKLVFSKLKETLGLNRLKFAVSGGAPLSVSDAEFFLGMGIVILEGFGLTETTPVTNANMPGIIKPGTVGPALKDTTIKISDEGEILVKGPQVMLGYYKNKEATREVMTKDGFFRTGDVGVIDEKGRLAIVGRIKDIIVTAGGKNISPQNIENSLKESKFIEQAAIIGDKRKYLSALVIPAFEELSKWAKRNQISFSSNSDLIKKPEVIKLIEDEIAEYTKELGRVEKIKKFRLLDAEWTQATGELTPTLKVKRKIVSEKYAKEIDSMYVGEDKD